MILKELKNAGLLHLNGYDFIVDNCIMVALTGSIAYGASTDNSDVDIFGVTVPSEKFLRPSKYNEIEGFSVGRISRWDEYQQHHIAYGEAKYDIKIYSIVKFFQLAMNGNPNVIDMLFCPANCVLHIDTLMQRILMQKHIFLSKQCYDRFRGFAYNHLKSMQHVKSGRSDKYGYCVKDFSHVVRQLKGIIEILETGYYILNKNAQEIIDIRNGKYNFFEAGIYGMELFKRAERAKEKSLLREKPDYDAIKKLLVDTVDEFYMRKSPD